MMLDMTSAPITRACWCIPLAMNWAAVASE
jgi:hypothetical protein